MFFDGNQAVYKVGEFTVMRVGMIDQGQVVVAGLHTEIGSDDTCGVGL